MRQISPLLLTGLLSLGVLARGETSRASEPKSGERFADPASVVHADSGWKQRWSGKLDEFERASGIKILVEFHAKSPSAEEDKIPGAYMHALSKQYRIDQRGVLAVYFADEDDWRLWIGDELAARFAKRVGTVKELTDNKAIHDAKEVLFKESEAKADLLFGDLQKASPPDRAPSPADRLRVRTEALLQGLMESLRDTVRG